MHNFFSAENWSTAFHLALFEVKMRYARSVLGPFWLTLQTLIFIVAIGVIFSTIFGTPIDNYMPFFSLSYVVWVFFSAALVESASVVVGAAPYLKDRGKKAEVFVMVAFLRNVIHLLHALPVVAMTFLYFRFPLHWMAWEFVPGFLMFLIALFLLMVIVAPLAAKFHDTTPLLQSLVTILFLISPIMWQPETVAKRPEILNFNPFYHLLEIWRGPLLGGDFPALSYMVSGGIILVLFVGALIAVRQYRKVAMWI